MKQFLTAFLFSLKEQITNKFAFGLLLVFVPPWYWALGVITPDTPVPFKFGPTGDFLQADGHHMIIITAGLTVLAMILGFMFFHSAHRSLNFDRRLTRSGLNRVKFMLAKILTLLLVTAVVAVYAVLILLIFWHNPNNIFEVWLSFWTVSLVYGAFGLLLGMLVKSDLAGFFTVIMVAMFDVFLQTPIGNPAGNASFLQYLPSYGSMQLGVAGGFTDMFAGKYLLLTLAWFVGFLLIALGIFYLRTRQKSSVHTVQSIKSHS